MTASHASVTGSLADHGDIGLSRVAAGRLAAVLFMVSGVMSLASLARHDAPGEDPAGVLAVGAAAALFGVLVWYLPWQAWPRSATLWLVPVGFACIALRNALGGLDPYLYPVFFVVLFTWVGIAHPRWTSLKLTPLFAAAYLTPLIVAQSATSDAYTSSVYVGLACVLVGETLAWVSARVYAGQGKLLRVRVAVDEIGADLSGDRDPRQLWQESAERLSRLVDLPDCDIYRLTEAGELVCIASVYDGAPCPEYVGVRGTDDLWSADREALRTHQPVLVASPDDPRLSDQEREEMLRWRESAMLIVPLMARDGAIGLVEISETRPGRSIHQDQIATTVTLSRMFAMAIHDAELLEERERHAATLASLLESSQAMASAASLEDALAILTRCGAEVLGFSECVAFEYEPESDVIVARGMWERRSSGWDRLGEPIGLPDHPVERRVLDSGSPLVERISDPGLDAISRAVMEERGEKTCVTVPMGSVDGVMGLLVFWDTEHDRDLGEPELALVGGLSDMAGEAVRGAKLVRKLTALSESDALTGLANHRKLNEVLEAEWVRAQRYGGNFSLAMIDVDNFKLLNDTHGHPAGDDVLRQLAGLLGARVRQSDVVGRYGGDEFLLVLPETAGGEAECLATELLELVADTPYVTEAGERIPLWVSAGIATYPQDGRTCAELVAAADANLYASKRRGGGTVTRDEEGATVDFAGGGWFGLFESLVTAVDNKDSYTRRHSEQVTDHALELARDLGLSEETQRVLRVAALLHDVGKIGIPDRILRKPSHLSEGEYEVVKGHAALGETIIGSLPDVDEIRGAVASHHERFDGRGYPRGLKGAEIPLLGRVLAVADAYSAMTTNRPYRQALSPEQAVAELRACAGSQFDPRLVEAFVGNLEAKSSE